jgi:cyclase
MLNTRLIARLDIKGENLIKGIHLEGLRVMGSPNEHAKRYYLQGADELIYMDCVASLYGRNNLSEIVKDATRDVFIPITVGGGIRSIEDATHLLRCGADKVAVNTAAIDNPSLISEISRRFGRQCMVLSVEAKHIGENRWEAYTDNGRECTGLDVIEWVKEGVELGAGEILLTSIDKEGTRKGFDLELIKAVREVVSVPVIASGGMGKPEDIKDVVKLAGANAVAMADILHYRRAEIGDIRAVAEAAAKVILSASPEEILAAKRVVLPGVGAFGSGIQALDALQLVPVIQEVAERGIPLLGICLGMQLLLEHSEEFGSSNGLGLIPGHVTAIPDLSSSGEPLNIPHIGWNEIFPPKQTDWHGTLLSGNQSGDAMYFVHSFMANPDDNKYRFAECTYGGYQIAAVIRKDNIMGFQFHPEKSGENGLKVLRQFLEL